MEFNIKREENGNIDLSWSYVTELPDGLEVERNLLIGNTNIEKLPKNLIVHGSLYAEDTPLTELPDDLKVDGSVILKRSRISKLPENFTANKDLNLNHTDITELPDGLKTGGSLSLAYTDITKLPVRLEAGGSLNLSYTGITELPDDLKVDGSVDLSYSDIEELPEGFTAGGSLYLEGAKITELPEGLKIGGSVILRRSRISKLPDEFETDGSLNLSDTRITELPDGLAVYGNLDLWGTDIAELPNGLKVSGRVVLEDTAITEIPAGSKINCKFEDISKLPENMTVIGGNFDLLSTRISKLPEGTVIEGALILNNEIVLPEGLTVEDTIRSDYRSAPLELPKNLTIGAGLDLLELNVTKVNEGLTVGGDFDTRGVGLKELPNGLSVGGNLIVEPDVKLPDDLKVKGKIIVDDKEKNEVKFSCDDAEITFIKNTVFTLEYGRYEGHDAIVAKVEENGKTKYYAKENARIPLTQEEAEDAYCDLNIIGFGWKDCKREEGKGKVTYEVFPQTYFVVNDNYCHDVDIIRTFPECIDIVNERIRDEKLTFEEFEERNFSIGLVISKADGNWDFDKLYNYNTEDLLEEITEPFAEKERDHEHEF